MTVLDYTNIPAPRPTQLRRWVVASILGVIVLAGGALRFVYIGGPVFTLDEYWHAELSAGRGSEHNRIPLNRLFTPTHSPTSLDSAPPFWRVWTRMDHTVHPPLFPQLLRIWRALLGEGEGASRALPAAASFLSIFALFDLMRRLHGHGAALWAAAIFALASPQIMLARDLRGYTLALLLLLCLADAIVSLEQNPDRPRRRLVAMALLTAATLLTHYFTLFILAALGIYVLLRLRGRLRINAVVAMTIGGGIFLISWAPWMIEQRHTLPARTDHWIYDGWPGHVQRVFEWAGSLPLRMLFEPRQSMAGVAIMGASLYLVPIVFLRRRPELLLWTLWLWCAMTPLLAMDLARDTKHLYHIRYSLAAGPAVYALLVTMLQHLENRALRHALPAVAVIASALSLGSAYEEPRQRWDQLAAHMDQHMLPGDIVAIHTTAGHWYGHAMYLCLSHESKRFPWRTVIFDQLPPPPDVMDELRNAPGVWLLREGAEPWPITAFREPTRDLNDPAFVPFVGYASHVRFVRPEPTSQPTRD